MSQRIRYIKDGEELISTRFVTLVDGEASVRIIPSTKVGYINTNQGVVVVEGSSLHKVKMAVKAKLIELGAVFEEEKRNTNGE